MVRRVAFILAGVAMILSAARASFDQGLNYCFYCAVGGALVLYGVFSPRRRPDHNLVIYNPRFCRKCGYDVSSSKEACSERGWPIERRVCSPRHRCTPACYTADVVARVSTLNLPAFRRLEIPLAKPWRPK